MASPLVASAAALVKAKYPSYTGLQVGEVLRTTADPIDNLNPTYAGKLGRGRLNVYNALTQTTSSVRYQQVLVADQTNGSRAAGNEITLRLDLKSFLAPITGLNVNITSTSDADAAFADAKLRTVLQHGGAHALFVVERAVGRIEILQIDILVPHFQQTVVARNFGVA